MANPAGEATDPGVGGYRPSLVQAESQGRAEWKASRRAGRAVAVDVTVRG